MLLIPVALLAIVAAGWGLGRARAQVDLITIIFTVFAAVTAHSGMQFAFVDGRLDQALGDPRDGAPAAVIVLIAAGEAVGLWLPFLVLPWTRMGARAWGALYAVASATLAAAHYYFPFDLIVISNEVVSGFGPPYLLAVIVCLPIAGVGYLLGLARAYSKPEEPPELADF
jgi:hypothetical protein